MRILPSVLCAPQTDSTFLRVRTAASFSFNVALTYANLPTMYRPSESTHHNTRDLLASFFAN